MRQRASTDGWPPHREPEFPARKPSGQCILDVLRNLQPALTTRLFGVNLPKNARSAEGDPKAPEVLLGETCPRAAKRTAPHSIHQSAQHWAYIAIPQAENL